MEGVRAQLAMCHSVEPKGWPDVAPALVISAAMELRRVGSRFLRLYLLYLLGYNALCLLCLLCVL